MRTIVRWNPIRELMAWQSALDQMFEDPYLNVQPETPTWSLAVDVAETDDHYIVKASIPGVNPDALEVTLEDNLLTIQGETTMDESLQEANFHLRERRYGQFRRSLRFPLPVNADAVEAAYEYGVLTLTVPKAEAVRPKRIAVRSNGHAKVIEG